MKRFSTALNTNKAGISIIDIRDSIIKQAQESSVASQKKKPASQSGFKLVDSRFATMKVMVVGAFKAKTGGGGNDSNSPPSMYYQVAVIETDEIDVDFAKECENGPCMLSRNVKNAIDVDYAVYKESDAKKAPMHYSPLSNYGLKYTLKTGTMLLASSWVDVPVKQGSIASLSNFRINEKRANDVSSFFVNVRIQEDLSPLNDVPIHTRLRTYWPITDQSPTTLTSIKKRRQAVHDLTVHLECQPFGTRDELEAGKFKQSVPFKLHHRYVKPSDPKKAATGPRSRKTFLLALAGSGLNGKELMPSCDEYDSQYQKLIESVASTGGGDGGTGSNKGDAMVGKSENATNDSADDDGDVVDDDKMSESEAAMLDFSTRSGYICKVVDWPVDRKQYTYEDKTNKELKTLMHLDVMVVSWGDPMCHKFKNYVNPMSYPDMNPSNGLCENPNPEKKKGEEYLCYDFKRLMFRITLWARDMQGLGPTTPEDIANLLSCYQVPVDVLLSPDEGETLKNTYNGDIEKKQLEKQDADKVSELANLKKNINGDPERHLAYLEKKEQHRWRTLNAEEYENVKMDAEAFYEQTKDGIIEQQVLMASWRIGELVKEAAIRISPKLATEQLKEIAQHKLMTNTPNNANLIGCENANGVVYLNEGLTLAESLSGDYTYYALVCYVEPARSVSMEQKRKRELEQLVEKSKNPTLSGLELDAINEDFIKNTNAHVYYYALKHKVLERSALFAKNTLIARMNKLSPSTAVPADSHAYKQDGIGFNDVKPSSGALNGNSLMVTNENSTDNGEPLAPSFCFGAESSTSAISAAFTFAESLSTGSSNDCESNVHCVADGFDGDGDVGDVDNDNDADGGANVAIQEPPHKKRKVGGGSKNSKRHHKRSQK